MLVPSSFNGHSGTEDEDEGFDAIRHDLRRASDLHAPRCAEWREVDDDAQAQTTPNRNTLALARHKQGG